MGKSTRKSKHIYGKPRDIKYPYKKRIFDLFQECLEKIRSISSDSQINNLIVVLRGTVDQLIDQIYQQLSIELKQGIFIEPSSPMKAIASIPMNPARCEVCQENRVINECHIIPRELGGSFSS